MLFVVPSFRYYQYISTERLTDIATLLGKELSQSGWQSAVTKAEVAF